MDILKEYPRELVWVGNSRGNLKEFPSEVRTNMGYALRFAQVGEKHPHAKPFKGLGSGVFEIVEDFRTDTYRAVYTVRFESAIYVLHAFQKKSKTGIKTPQKDIDLISARYRRAKEMEDEKSKS